MLALLHCLVGQRETPLESSLGAFGGTLHESPCQRVGCIIKKCILFMMFQESFEFVVYMIHACANKWNCLPSFVYRKLKASGCIQEFLVPNYEILHTQSTDFVVRDIEEYLKVRKVAI